MTNLYNVLSFIKKKNISNRKFEIEASLSNGTINGCLKSHTDLSQKNIEKISKRYGLEMLEYGFFIIDTSAFGTEGYAIVNEGQKEKIELVLPYQSIKNEPDSTESGPEEKDDPTLTDVMLSLKSLKKDLNKVLNHQVHARAEVRGFGEYQVMKDARNDEGRRVAIMAQINKLIDENLADGALEDIPA